MNSIQPWILAARPKTLFATLAPIIVGISLSYKMSNTINWGLTALIVLSAVLLQIGSNYANDAYDYLKGADTKNRKGPKRMVQSGILSANSILNAMYAIFILSVLIGYFLARIGGWPIIVIGLLSIVFAIIYTAGPYPLAYNGLGEITVFIFFGIIATIGTLYLQIVNIDSYFNLFTLEVFVAASSVGLLNTAILVVNNLRDIDPDKLAGKKTLAVKFGNQFACYEFTLLLIINCLCYLWLALQWRNYDLIIAGILIAIPSIYLIFKIFNYKNIDLNIILERTAQLSFFNSIIFFVLIVLW